MYDIVYELLISETWIITIPVSVWFIGTSRILNKKYPLMILVGFSVSLVCHTILFMTGTHTDIVKFISDMIYDTLSPIGVYTVYELIKEAKASKRKEGKR